MLVVILAPLMLLFVIAVVSVVFSMAGVLGGIVFLLLLAGMTAAIVVLGDWD